jgi:hypothetical protein
MASGRAAASQDDSFQSIQVLADGGFITAGETNSKSPEGSNAWITRLDATGGTLWEKAFGPKGEVPASLDERGMYSEAKAVAALCTPLQRGFSVEHKGNCETMRLCGRSAGSSSPSSPGLQSSSAI